MADATTHTKRLRHYYASTTRNVEYYGATTSVLAVGVSAGLAHADGLSQKTAAIRGGQMIGGCDGQRGCDPVNEDVALGHETKMRWNSPDKWVWSTDHVHEPLIDPETFEHAHHLIAALGRVLDRRGPGP